MQPAKQEALETIGKLADDADMDEIMYRLYVLDKIRIRPECRGPGSKHHQRGTPSRDR